tara:strand:+ start:918 stop:1049 length:132 start_codon:yes stop_codon:yes gene_type:complete
MVKRMMRKSSTSLNPTRYLNPTSLNPTRTNRMSQNHSNLTRLT